MQSETFKIALADWTDKDVAAFELSVCLGLMQSGDFQTKTKHIFWSNNKIGNVLYQFIDSLVEIHILKANEDEQVRWNKSFCNG